MNELVSPSSSPSHHRISSFGLSLTSGRATGTARDSVVSRPDDAASPRVMAGPGRPPKNRAEASGVDAKDAVSAACGHGAMAKLKGALRRLKPTPGDAKTDLLLVIASRLIMNDGNGVAAADVVAACAVPPADAWIRRTFGDGVAITPAMVETALRAAKDHFSRGKDARYHLAGWPLPRRAQCAVGASFVTDDRLGVTPTTPTKEGGGGGGGGGTGGKPAGGGKSKATPPRAGAKRKEREVEEGARVAATATATAATAATATAANADAAGAEPEKKKKKKKKEKAAAAKKNAGLPPKASSADAAATANASAPPPAAHNPHNVRVSGAHHTGPHTTAFARCTPILKDSTLSPGGRFYPRTALRF